MFIDTLKEKAVEIVNKDPGKILKKLFEEFEKEIEQEWVPEQKEQILKKIANYDFSDIDLSLICKYTFYTKKDTLSTEKIEHCGCQYCRIKSKYIDLKKTYKRILRRYDLDMMEDFQKVENALEEYKLARYRSKVAKVVTRFNEFKKIYEEYKEYNKRTINSTYSHFKFFLRYKYSERVCDMFGSTIEMFSWFFPREYELTIQEGFFE